MSLSKAQTLAKEADRAAYFRGHNLGSWRWEGTDTRMQGTAYCLDCHKAAMIDTKPSPNGIDVSGEAVALSCKER